MKGRTGIVHRQGLNQQAKHMEVIMDDQPESSSMKWAKITHTCGRSWVVRYLYPDDIYMNPEYCPVCEIKFFPKKFTDVKKQKED